MKWIFNIENPVMCYIIKLFDMMCLSGLWLLFSLPVVTMGASSTALYTAVHRYIRKEEGYLWHTFWKAFKENLKRSTIVWLAALAVLLLLVIDAFVFRSLEVSGNPMGKLYWAALVLNCIAVTWVVYLSAYAARFDGSAKDVLRFSFLLLAAHPIKAIGVFFPVLGGVMLVITAPALIIIVPAAMCLLCSITTEKVFSLHMRPEDIEKEKDRQLDKNT